MKNVLTASERRGIIVVAALALLITGSGWVVSMCQRNMPDEEMPEVEVLVSGDSVIDVAGGVDGKSEKTRKRKKERFDSLGNKSSKTPKTYRRRSPRDESV